MLNDQPNDEAMMARSQVPVLLGATPGPLCSALQSLLMTLPQVRSVQTVETPAQVLEILPTLLTTANMLVLIILILEKGQVIETVLAIIRRIRQIAPAARIAILTDDLVVAANDCFQAPVSQVNLVLQQGSRPEVLVACFEQLLSSEVK